MNHVHTNFDVTKLQQTIQNIWNVFISTVKHCCMAFAFPGSKHVNITVSCLIVIFNSAKFILTLWVLLVVVRSHLWGRSSTGHTCEVNHRQVITVRSIIRTIPVRSIMKRSYMWVQSWTGHTCEVNHGLVIPVRSIMDGPYLWGQSWTGHTCDVNHGQVIPMM